MSEPDRGAYTPPSDPFALHPRAPVRSGPAPVTLAASMLVLVAAAGAVYFVYKGGVRHKGEPPASVGAPVGQIRTGPPPPAAGAPAELVVDRGPPSAAVNAPAPTFAPPPETPQPLPAASLRPAALPAPAMPSPAPPPVPQTPVAAPAPPATVPPPAVARAAPPPPAAAKGAPPPSIASLTDQALRGRAAAAPPRAAPVAPGPAPAAPGAAVVQIGAFSSAALAEQGWADLSHAQPAAMAGKGRSVEAAQKDGRSFYRAYVTGFASRTAAQTFCDRLKAGGHACFVK